MELVWRSRKNMHIRERDRTTVALKHPTSGLMQNVDVTCLWGKTNACFALDHFSYRASSHTAVSPSCWSKKTSLACTGWIQDFCSLSYNLMLWMGWLFLQASMVVNPQSLFLAVPGTHHMALFGLDGVHPSVRWAAYPPHGFLWLNRDWPRT